MNVATPAVSMMVFGIIIGITSTHFHQVNHLVKHGIPSLLSSVDASESESPADSTPVPSPSVALAASDTVASQRPAMMPEMAIKENSHNDALLEILAAIRNEQKSIRKQISESNRDIDELTFRVDTHSDSFKPLQTEVERPRSLNYTAEPLDGGGIGLLPPKQ